MNGLYGENHMSSLKDGEIEHIVQITITGESALDLIAVGKKDLLSHFLPKGLMVKESDCKVYMEKRVGNSKSVFGYDTYFYKEST